MLRHQNGMNCVGTTAMEYRDSIIERQQGTIAEDHHKGANFRGCRKLNQLQQIASHVFMELAWPV